jgi:hypothetical protein
LIGQPGLYVRLRYTPGNNTTHNLDAKGLALRLYLTIED